MPRLLRLVGQAQGTDPPARRPRSPAPSLSLTSDEARHVRASIRNIARTRFGTFAAMARALGVVPDILTHRRPPSPGLVIALWRLTGVPVEELLTGSLAAVPAPASTREGGAA